VPRTRQGTPPSSLLSLATHLRTPSPDTSRVPRALAAAAVLALVAAACGGTEERESRPSTPPPRIEPGPPPAPETFIRVVDGDTAKPVGKAHVFFAGGRADADRAGIAELGVPLRRIGVRIAAPGYAARDVRVDFRRRRVQKVELWRPALQWPVYGANPARTQAHRGIKLRPPFRVRWSRSLQGLVEFPAVVWQGVAYVNNIHGVLRAISMRSGRILWERRLGTLSASSPGLDPSRRVLVTPSMSPGYVSVVSMDTGRVRWRIYTGRAEPSPVIRDGIAYFAAANGNVYALNLERRRMRWVFHGGVKITSSPALVGNRLYVGDYAGRVFALDARTGRRLWTGSAGSRVYGTVAVADGRVFAPSVFSGLSALSARSGRLLWRIPVGAYLYSSPAAYHRRVYFGTYAGIVYCASARSGRILWSRSAGGSVSGAVQVVAGVVYAASMGSRTTAWDWRTGRPLWMFPHGRYVPVSGNGARLLLHGTFRIWAVEPKKKKR
jgi:outer membrane protein assembly factor BamB